MAYSLKTSGQALDLKVCLLVNEDGTTVTDLVSGNTISVHANVLVGSATWKGTTRKFAQTGGSGYTPYGVTWTGTKPMINPSNSAGGMTVMGIFAGVGTGANQKSFMNISELSGLRGVMRNTNGAAYFRLTPSPNEAYVNGNTNMPSDLSTKGSIAFDYTAAIPGQIGSTGNIQAFYGAEGGSLAADSTARFPLDTSVPTGPVAIYSVGGAGGQGYQNHKFFAWLVFQGQRTLAQKQAIHNDWFGALIQGAVALTRKLKIGNIHPDAIGVSVAGSVFTAPTGGNMLGTEIGKFVGRQIVADGSGAKIVIPVNDFGGGSLLLTDNPVVVLQSPTGGAVGDYAATVIEEA